MRSNFGTLYKQYLLERQDTRVIESPEGFATYRFVDRFVYLEDIYIEPVYRNAKAARLLLEQVEQAGAAKGIKEIMGSIVPSLPGAKEMLAIMTHVGFKLYSSDKDIIYLVKPIGLEK